MIDATSFEMEERLYIKYENQCLVRALFLDPGEGTLYANVEETIYEWNLRKNEPGPEWWIREE